ncbi:ABC transporter substrate-binding protein, partial [Clostridium sp. Cult1]|uniref:ABC transporter substrate-binding protein n=1 Tax=Clostridium sp. Cult1 TaxID=2079002 RepID=UPI001F33941C
MKRLIALTMALLIIITGCSQGGKKTSGDNVAAVQEYRTVYSGEITTLNYLVTSTTNEFAIAANLVDTLIDYDRYGVVQPGLATEWSLSDDNLVWTFKIREGVKWLTHEGEEYGEVTAQDFVDAMKYILNPANESKTANIAYSVIKNAEEYYNGEIRDFEEVGVKALD